MATPTPLNLHPRPDDLHSDRWWRSEAHDHVLDGIWENLHRDEARRVARISGTDVRFTHGVLQTSQGSPLGSWYRLGRRALGALEASAERAVLGSLNTIYPTQCAGVPIPVQSLTAHPL